MGLVAVVGRAAFLDDAEGLQWHAEQVGLAREVLRAAGLPTWDENQDAEPVEAELGGYSTLHTLRRLAAHLQASGSLPPPLGHDEDATADPVLRAAYEEGTSRQVHVRRRFRRLVAKATSRTVPRSMSFDHLIHHSDAEGLYVLVDLEPVVVCEELPGTYVGSAPRLLSECLRVAGALGLDPDTDPMSEEVLRALDGDGGSEPWARYGAEAFASLQLIVVTRAAVRDRAAVVFT